jgi:oligopeptide/dipeptide ABC transporter ATP-binding protein
VTKEAGAPNPAGTTPLLSVRDLHVSFRTEDGVVRAVDGLSFDVERGRTLGIVGESGSGKSVTNLTILGLHNPMFTTVEGEILLDGRELTTARESELEKLRGNKVAMIFQDPLTALSPYYTVGRQIADLLKDLQREFGSGIIFITHDLGVIADMADDIMVMYAGGAVERGTTDEVLRSPRHPYTWGLLNSMPRLDSDLGGRLSPIPGTPPSLLNPPSGCRFHPRCTYPERVEGTGRCVRERPLLAPDRASACHLTEDQKRTIFIEEIKPRLG